MAKISLTNKSTIRHFWHRLLHKLYINVAILVNLSLHKGFCNVQNSEAEIIKYCIYEYNTNGLGQKGNFPSLKFWAHIFCLFLKTLKRVPINIKPSTMKCRLMCINDEIIYNVVECYLTSNSIFSLQTIWVSFATSNPQ